MFLGADTEALRASGEAMASRGQRLGDLASEVRTVHASVHWVGPDAEAFREVTQAVLRHVEDVARDVATRGRELDEEAAEQDRASEDGGHAGSGQGGDGAPDRSNQEGGRDGARTTPIRDGIPMDDAALSPENIAQGGQNDCGLLSSLGALGQMDPQFLRDHVKEVSPGVYEVTMYDKDGDPVLYRIEKNVLDNGARGEDGRQSLASVYEEAYMMHTGGSYKGLDGIFPEDALEAMTGEPASKYSGDDRPSAEDMRRMLEHGRPIVADTAGNDMPSDPRIVGTHAYTVTAVDTAAEPPTVTVVNPWSNGSMHDPNGPQQTVTMTYEEFQKEFVTTTVGRTREASLGDRWDEFWDGTGKY